MFAHLITIIKKENKMEIFNKSKRHFHVSTGVLKHEQTITVPDEEGAKLVEAYKNEIIQIGNTAVEKENAELKAKVAELEEELTAPEKAKKSKKV